MKITLVSFVPWPMREMKPGVIPGDYLIEASDGKTPAVLVIDDAITNVYMGAEQGTWPSAVPVEQLARSIVRDSVSASLEIDEDARPAFFWVPGALTAEQVLKQFPKECQENIDKQKRWGLKLIKVADDVWARFHQHKMVPDPARVFARLFGQSKEWALAPEPVTLVKCFACSQYVESTAIVCKHCRAILDKARAKDAGIVFAGA